MTIVYMIFNNTDCRYYIFVPQKIALILQSGKYHCKNEQAGVGIHFGIAYLREGGKDTVRTLYGLPVLRACTVCLRQFFL